MKKIPDNATLVFKGERFCVWQWDQELFDGSHKIFESITRADVSTVVALTKEKKLLLLEETQSGKKPLFTFPSGTLESDDTPLSCAKRELKEETGYTAGETRHWFTVSAGNSVVYDYHIYIANDCVKDGEQHLDPGEQIIVSEISLDDLVARIEDIPYKNNALYPYLLKAKYSETEKQKLKDLLGITTSDKT